jgi:uroporphyrinogen III methyltransferase / synthase
MTGFISLIGAGPGDPGLITAKGLDRLRRADVVVFDALANPRLLREARPDARQIDVGKRGGAHKLTQDQTNQLLVDLAGEGLKVVRLKGGDPYLFGRGAEEAAFLARQGVSCEVIPGITSGIAAPAYAGIPVTHRKVASTVTFVTGHEDPTKPDTAVDYKSLAGLIAAGGTACFYMGIGQLPKIVASLTRHALDPATPAAVVQWGTRTKQRSVRGALDRIEQLIKDHGIGSPAIILVGQVAGLNEPGLDFFTSRPLFGQRVLVTRSRQQASQLSQGLEELGAEVYEAPTIRVVPPDNFDELDRAVGEIAGYGWLVLTSANGVDALADRMEALRLDARHLAGVKVASVGDATSEALGRRLGIRPDFVPVRTMGEALAQELIDREAVGGQRMLLLRADIARPALPKLLGDAGAKVTELVVYQTKIADALPDDVLEALGAGGIDWVTFTSSSTASNLVELLGEKRSLLDHVKTASIGPVTSRILRDLGLNITIEAGSFSVPGLIEALTQAVGQ